MEFLVSEFGLSCKKNKVVCNDIPYTEAKFKKHIPKLLNKSSNKDATQYRLLQLEDMDTFNDEVTRLFYKITDKPSAPVSSSLREIVDTHEPIQDVVTGHLRLLHSGTGLVSPVDFSVYRTFFTSKEWDDIKKEIHPYIIKYSVAPLEPNGTVIYNTGPKEFPQANSHIPPRWRFCTDTGEDLHDDHKKMIYSRFANAEMRERYLCALYHTITDRNKNICLLVHKREGTGKSTVMGFIPGCLVGMENTSFTDKNFMASPHKDAFLNKRMVFLDEHRVTKGQVAIEKQFVEDMLYVNPKGRAAITIPNTISFFGASNEISDIYTEPTNRRHYFLEDSGKHVIDEFGVEFIDNYKKRMTNDPDFVANLGFWILRNFNKPKYPADAVYRGPTFEQVVRATAFHYYDEIIESLLNGDEISYVSAKKAYNKQHRTNNRGEYFPRLQTFMDFFKHFTWSGETICTMEQSDLDNDIVLKPIGG